MARYLKEYGTDLVLHGQTAEDLLNHKTSFPAMLGPLPRRRIVAPLRDWTAEEVLAYCQRRRVPLPEQYATGLADSLECWNTVTITVTSEDGNKTAECKVTVSGADTEVNGVKFEFVSIPAGSFKMGSPYKEPLREDDENQHDITLSSFYMSKYEVTQTQ